MAIDGVTQHAASNAFFKNLFEQLPVTTAQTFQRSTFGYAGTIALSSFISPYRADRDQVRKLHEEADYTFIEIFVDCSLEEAEKRDPKGLYKKARAGEIKGFTGIDDPYEAPEKAEIHLHTDESTLEEEVDILINELVDRGFLLAYR